MTTSIICGDYVLASKYSDEPVMDTFVIGRVCGFNFGTGNFLVRDGKGVVLRTGWFRVEKITIYEGEFLSALIREGGSCRVDSLWWHLKTFRERGNGVHG